MHTISLTGSIFIAAPPEAVISLLGDARQLPFWAPGFARHVQPEGGQWIAEASDGTRTRFAIRTAPDQGTVDILVSQALPRGAYLRVLGNGGGTELVLALLVPDPGETAARTRQQQVLQDELRNVRDLAEGATPTGRAAGNTHAAGEA